MRFEPDPPDAVTHLAAADPALRRIIELVGPPRIRPTGTPYEALMRSILYQQLAGAAAAAIERRFLALFAGRLPSPEQLLAADVETVRSTGISRTKVSYLRSVAEHALTGTIGDHLFALPDAEVVARVTAIHGVGRWTADMLLIFCLGRPDVLPVGDLDLRTAVARLDNLPRLPAPHELLARTEPWRPYRSMGTWYCWQWLELRLPDR